jgi:hypothetical protein
MAASILLGVLARRDGCSWTDLGLSRRRVRPGLRWGAITAAAVALGYAVAGALNGLGYAFAWWVWRVER